MLVRLFRYFFLLLILAPRPAASAGAAAQAPVDPRGLGLAGATLALPGGALSLRDNPASSAALLRSEIAVSHLSWLGDTFQDHLAGSFVVGRHGVLNAGLGYFSVPKFDSTDGREAAISAGLARADLGYAFEIQGRMGSLSLGSLASYLDQRLGHLALRDLEVALGLAWKTPWKYLLMGAAAKQIGVYSTRDSRSPFELGAGLGAQWERFSVDFDLSRQGEKKAQLRLGAEWRPLSALALRLGFYNADGWAISTGFGLKWKRWDLGLGWQGRGDLGSAMLVSLGTHWGAAGPTSTESLPERATKVKPAQTGALPRDKVAEPSETAEVAPPAPAGPSQWASGDFELQAITNGQRVSLSWSPQRKKMPKMAAYEVLMGMVAEAPLQKAAQATVQEPRWSQEMAVRGMTYYFRVRVLGQGGELLSSSKIKAVKMH